METLEQLTAEHEQCSLKLKWLRSFGTSEAWRMTSSEEKMVRHDQERYLSEYIRTLNRLIALATFR